MIVQNLNCTVNVTTLKNAPFLLPWGASVRAQVIATNVYGDSIVSSLGNGAVIIRSPDAPILSENVSQRTPTSFGLTWTDALENGGTPVIDY